MIRTLLALAFVHMTLLAQGLAEWTPPDNPDLQEILGESKKDARAQNYELAFEKLVWFRDHAVSINPAFAGVRDSFALSQLCDLSDDYEPAKKKVDQIRADAAASVIEGGARAIGNFIVVGVIDRHRGDSSKTVELFEALAESNPGSAYMAYRSSEKAIIELERFDLVKKYLEPRPQLRRAEERLESLMTRQRRRPELRDMSEHAIRFYRKDVATTGALLVKTNRHDDAEKSARGIRAYWADAVEEYGFQPGALDSALEDALNGKIPSSWF